MKDLAVSFCTASSRYMEIPAQEASWILNRGGNWTQKPTQVFGDNKSRTLSRWEMHRYITGVIATAIEELLETHTFNGAWRHMVRDSSETGKSSIYSPAGISWTHGLQLSYPDKLSMIEVFDKDIRFDPIARRWGRTYKHFGKARTNRQYTSEESVFRVPDIGFREPARVPNQMRIALATMILHRVLTTNIEEYLGASRPLLPEEYVDVLVNGIRDKKYSLKDTEYKVYKDGQLRYVIKHCRTSKLITCWTASAWYECKSALYALATGKECKFNGIYSMRVNGEPVCTKK